MKERTLNRVNLELRLAEIYHKNGNKLALHNTMHCVPSTGMEYYINEIVKRGIGRIEEGILKFNYIKELDNQD
jgi:hypothetical protein